MNARKILTLVDYDESFYQYLDCNEGLRNFINKVKSMGKREYQQTKEMFNVFGKLLKSKLKELGYDTEKPSNEEIRRALDQLKDIGKIAFIVSLFLVPIPGMGLLTTAIETVARKFGVTIFPT